MQEFLKHVKQGLSKKPKKLSSRYFYDANGDAIFQQIMQLDEYYLPVLENEIILQQSKQIAQDIAEIHQSIEIVELGAGDGSKTKTLLEQFLPNFETLKYIALDISENILSVNRQLISQSLPNVEIQTVTGNYFKTYPEIPKSNDGRLVLFLGANIGNFTSKSSVDFFKFIKLQLHPNDFFLVAFDMVKDPRKIIKAYDDSQGVTKAFNLNLLERINRELGADFEVSKFEHFPFYNPIKGITSSQIISLEPQVVTFKDGFRVNFDAFEAIHTEISKKYFHSDITSLASQSNMHIFKTYFNATNEYAFVLFKPINV